jgi:TPR repeat protein
MTIKELAYSAQKHLKSSTGHAFKRAHVYELLAAAFGFNSYAAVSTDSVFTRQSLTDPRDAHDSVLIKQRCIELGCAPDKADAVMSALEAMLTEQQIGVIRLSALLQRLRAGGDDVTADSLPPMLLAGLDAAASKDNVLAHYALALIYAPDDDEARPTQMEKYTHHLREAGRLGNRHALLELADRFDDPTFFEQPRGDIDADPAAIAAIAEGMGRTADAKYWLTVAARKGDTDAMLQLIEEYDRGDLLRCWTWRYLAQLVGDDGLDYKLASLSAEQEAIAREVAQELFERIPQVDAE